MYTSQQYSCLSPSRRKLLVLLTRISDKVAYLAYVVFLKSRNLAGTPSQNSILSRMCMLFKNVGDHMNIVMFHISKEKYAFVKAVEFITV